jgi:nucleotide-binding universal stress UspA family protein
MAVDEFDQPYTNVMERAKAKAAETWREDAPAPVERQRRPAPMLNPPKPSGNLIAALLVAGAFAAIFVASLTGGPAPETSERPAPPPAVEQAPPPVAEEPAPAAAPPAAPAAEQPAPALAIEPIDCAAEPGAWGCEPPPAPVQAAPIYVAPAAKEPEPVLLLSAETAVDDGLGSMPKPCTHPRCTP